MNAVPAPPIRVMLVDDHEMLADSLVRLLRAESDIDVVGVTYTAQSAIEFAASQRPDIVVMDYGLPDLDGATAAARIIEAQPDTQVILLTGSGAEVAAFEAARAGCAGYLEKTSAIDGLISSIRDVHYRQHHPLNDDLARLPATDELVVHYQSIIELATARTLGFEALVRWAHPTLGLVPPDAFIPLAEQTSLIIDIGEHVRATACQQAADWQQRHTHQRGLLMSVNVSGRELALTDLADRVQKNLTATGLDPRSLIVEITETFLIDDADASARRLQDLRELGVRVALDDFGTGFSSLDYLRRFPIDIIKLDRAFTHELPDGQRALRLADAVGQLAASMDAVALAEGIETAGQAQCLRDIGWPLGQGYYFSHPMPASEAETLLD